MDISPDTTPELFLPESRTEHVYTVVAILMALSTVAVGLRFYARAVVIHNLGTDDWVALVALVFLYALGSGTFVMAGRGLGKHIGLLQQPDSFKSFMSAFWVVIILYNASILCVRLCFLAQYYRIMALKNMRRAVVIVAGLVSAWSLSQILLSIFQCTPVSGFWDRGPDTKCVTSTLGWYMNAAGNIISDVLVLLLPLPMIKSLNLPRNQKIALACIFGLGFFTCAISVIRIQYLSVTIDVSWVAADAQFWSVAEICSGIVCAALSTLRPLFGRWLPRMFGSAQQVSSSYHKGSSRKPRDIESSGLRSHATRRGTKQFSRIDGEADEELMCSPAEHEAGGSAFLTLSDSSIELQDRPNPSPDPKGNRDDKKNEVSDDDGPSSNSLPYPDPVYAGPISGSPRRSVDIVGGDASQMARTQEHENSVIRVKHEIEVRHDK